MEIRKEKKDCIRAAILEAAARKLREDGFNGIGVDALASEAGYTSGAFYSNFGSKQELLVEVLRRGFDEIVADTADRIEKRGAEWYEERIRHYLSLRHRNNVAEGCLLPNLSADSARCDRGVQTAYEEGFERLVEVFSSGLADESGIDQRYRAIAAISLMAGGVLLARAVSSTAAAEEILHACRKFAP